MDLTRAEQSLLLFLETQAVDHGGRVLTLSMNTQEMGTARQWSEAGYISFGRLLAADVFGRTASEKNRTHYVRLSEEAWADAARYRRARAERGEDSCVAEAIESKRPTQGADDAKETEASADPEPRSDQSDSPRHSG